VRDNLFDDNERGFDLIAMQRGRDHGLPGYARYYEACNPGKFIRNFDDLRAEMSAEASFAPRWKFSTWVCSLAHPCAQNSINLLF
jgi:hypothetical protein